MALLWLDSCLSYGDLSFSFISGGTVTEFWSLVLFLSFQELTLLIADKTVLIVGHLQAELQILNFWLCLLIRSLTMKFCAFQNLVKFSKLKMFKREVFYLNVWCSHPGQASFSWILLLVRKVLVHCSYVCNHTVCLMDVITARGSDLTQFLFSLQDPFH